MRNPLIERALDQGKKTFGEVHANLEECSICLTPFDLKDDVIELKCSDEHVFHEDCL